MDLIHQLSNERQQLWQKAGHGELNDEEYWRLQQITRELSKLWDNHRRQRAAIAWKGQRQAAEARSRDSETLVRAA